MRDRSLPQQPLIAFGTGAPLAAVTPHSPASSDRAPSRFGPLTTHSLPAGLSAASLTPVCTWVCSQGHSTVKAELLFCLPLPASASWLAGLVGQVQRGLGHSCPTGFARPPHRLCTAAPPISWLSLSTLLRSHFKEDFPLAWIWEFLCPLPCLNLLQGLNST